MLSASKQKDTKDVKNMQCYITMTVAKSVRAHRL
jgi:hypothetical protein